MRGDYRHNIFMKKFKLLVALLISFTISSYAQDYVKSYSENTNKSEYSIFSIGYDLMFLNQDFPSLNGGTLQALHGFKLGKLPIYMESGIGMSYNKANTNSDFPTFDPASNSVITKTQRESISSFNAFIPINIGYSFNIKENLKFYPYTGIMFKYNAIFDYSSRYEDNYIKVSQYAESNDFQMGWQIGIKFFLSKLYIGVQYGLDFMPKANIITTFTPSEEFKQYYNYDISAKSKLKSSDLMLSVGIFL